MVRSDLAASGGAGLVGFQKPGGPAQTVQQQLDMLYYGISNVRDTQFAGGAKGDGVTDDTAAIQAAINSFGAPSTATGGAVFFPPGQYKITSSLYLNYNTSLIGDKFLTFIIADGDFEAIRWNSQIPSHSRHITIDGLRFVGAGVSSGFTNNTAIRMNHPWGLDHLSLKTCG